MSCFDTDIRTKTEKHVWKENIFTFLIITEFVARN